MTEALVKLCAAILVLGTSVACAAGRPGAMLRAPLTTERIATADALVREGCYDCLVKALELYEDVAKSSSASLPADRTRQATGLLQVREQAIGLTERHHLPDGELGTDEALISRVVAALPRRMSGPLRSTADVDIDRMMLARRNRDTWHTRLLQIADASALSAVTAVSFECTYPVGRGGAAEQPATGRIPSWRDTPLLELTIATCAGTDTARFSELLDADPRFVEINYFLGLSATLKGDLDEADRRFRRAFDWRQDWPAVTLAIANVAMAAEDFERASAFYQATLDLDPDNPDGRFGQVRARSYQGRYRSAIDMADRMLEGHWYVGDAYYWRAWNETQLGQFEQAWEDVIRAAGLLFDAEVPKLTGVLSVRRGDLVRARSEFEQARRRNADDCETGTLLGGTQLELQDWSAATSVLLGATNCLDHHDEELRAEIGRLRAKGGQERTLFRREQELTADGRLRAQTWFHLAVAAFNVGDTENARSYAERLIGDARLDEQARQLLARLTR